MIENNILNDVIILQCYTTLGLNIVYIGNMYVYTVQYKTLVDLAVQCQSAKVLSIKKF